MAVEDHSSVRVALRIRPQLAREKIEACRICTYVTPGEPQVTLGKDKAFTYDYVYDTPTEQHTVYETCIESLIEGCFEGYNATVLAYGQTGSGKTYTMGTGFDVTTSQEQLGIIPRAMNHLFKGINKRKAEALSMGLPAPEFNVTAQFMELYNEELVDLFDTTTDPANRGRSNIKIHEDSNGNIYTVGVTARQVANAEETLKCLHGGALNRTTAATQMNSQSSRSHAIFSVHIKQTRVCKPKTAESSSAATTPESEDGKSLTESSAQTSKSDLEFETLSAKFHFTDLAGSERLKRTGATGDRAKEGISINCGLLALGNVISALGDVSKKHFHIPYRDSKLTRLLQDSLGGNSRTLMVACISPSDSDFMETLNTLKYANRARNIKNKVVANQDTASKQMQMLRQQIATLQLELTEYKTGKRIVGEDGVEAYNDMFQENSMLQKENNNFRMKIKAMQETVENRNDRITQLTIELAQTKIAGGENNDDVVSMIENYVKEIEELRSKLLESEALCSNLRRKSDGMNPFGLPRSPTPIPMTGSVNVDTTLVSRSKSVLDKAKHDINQLEEKKEKLQQRKSSKQLDKDDLSKDKNNEEALETGAVAVNGSASEQSASEYDTDVSEADTESLETEDDDDDDDDMSETLQQEFATITYEIDVKQELVNELESLQRRITAMQRQYEEKLKVMAQTIRATELERDKVLKNAMDSKSSGSSEKVEKIKSNYKKQLDSMKKDMSKLKEAKKNHDRLIREQSKHINQLKSLRNELEQMKKTKVRLMRQIKEDQKKSKTHDSNRMKEIMKLKREFKMKSNEVRNLSAENRKKDLMVKRKQEELSVLRKQLKPISGKYGKQQQAQQLQLQLQASQQSQGFDSTFIVEKHSYTQPQASKNKRRERKPSSEFSSRTARIKWKSVQSKISEAVVQHETISRIDRQMERFIKERERLQRDIERTHRKKTRANVKGKDASVWQQLKDEEDGLQENIDYVNEQIQECQMEIMQVEESMEDTSLFSSLVQYCSINEARYLLENLISLTVSKASIGVQTQSRLKDVESKLQVSEESAKQAHDLMRYMLQERPNLDESIAECLNEYMKGANSDSSFSSRESSPDRDVGFTPANGFDMNQLSNTEIGNGDTQQRPAITKEVKARRRTATPQELLHGISPIRASISPIDSPILEKTVIFVNEGMDNSLTPTNSVNEAMTSNSGVNDVCKLLNTPPFQRTRLGTYTIDEDVETTSTATLPTEDAPVDTGSKELASTTETRDESPGPPGLGKAIPSNVFSRLTTYALSSPKTDKGQMQPYVSKSVTARSSPLLCTQVAKGHHKAVLCVQATDHLLFSGSKDRSVKVWNLVTGQEIMSLDGHPNNVNVVRHCPVTGLVYSVSLCYIKVWDIRSRARCIRVLSASGSHHLPNNFLSNVSRTNHMPDNEMQINDLKLSADNNMFYCASTTQVKIWDLNKFSVIGKLTGHTGNIMTMAVPTSGNVSVVTGGKDHFIKVYDLSGGTQGIINPTVTLDPPHMDGVETLALSSEKNILFSGSRDKSIKKWNVSSRAVIKSEYQAHSNWVCALDLIKSEDNDEVLVSGGRSGFLKLWDVESFGSIGSIRAHSDTINYIASNRTHIFTASSDRTIGIWKRGSKS
ncbi:unnamed protein product [Clavelina lepadiformis]|uniref:Kinesin motor domain-containing protein n=1 Tax=Clavelina lepadiformis TaxID=159417 RepID=A0ABP0FPJ6_CLALP